MTSPLVRNNNYTPICRNNASRKLSWHLLSGLWDTSVSWVVHKMSLSGNVDQFGDLKVQGYLYNYRHHRQNQERQTSWVLVPGGSLP